MSAAPNPSTTPADRADDHDVPSATRRRLLVGGAAAVAAGAAGVIAAQPASAANGGAFVLGKGNSATLPTSIAATTTGSGLAVTNTSSGAGATLASYLGHGAIGTTRAGNRYGAFASNSSATNGGGGALYAAGGHLNGVRATTAGVGTSAVLATQTVPLASANGNEAAVNAVGAAANGVIASSTNVDAFCLVATHFGSGVAVLGSSDAGVGVLGVGSGGGSGLWGTADDGTSYALTTEGSSLMQGDVVVTGTLYAPTVVNGLPPGFAGDGTTATTPTSASARRVAARAAKKAAQLRASLG